jgi:hypothetical protein
MDAMRLSLDAVTIHNYLGIPSQRDPIRKEGHHYLGPPVEFKATEVTNCSLRLCWRYDWAERRGEHSHHLILNTLIAASVAGQHAGSDVCFEVEVNRDDDFEITASTQTAGVSMGTTLDFTDATGSLRKWAYR